MFLRLGSAPTIVVYDHRDVALAPYGDYWRQMRKLCTIELLTAKRTGSFSWVREEEASAMVRSLREESKRGTRSVNLRNHIYSTLLNIVCRMFAGRSYSDYQLSGGQQFSEMVSEIMHLGGVVVLGDFIPSLAFLDCGGYRRRIETVHKVFNEFAENLIDEHVERRRVKKSEEADIVDVMLHMAESESREMQVSKVHMKAIILDMLLGGIESSATTVEWAMAELLRNPKAMAMAQQEIESEVGRDRIVRESDLVNFEYLRCVVKESVRLHPAGAFLIPHESTQGCSVGGYYIPPKTRLFVNIWGIGRDESVWEDALEFKPERFIGSSIDLKGQHFELLPFGTARRGCPGMSMGFSAVYLCVAQLIHCFDWSVEGDVDRGEVFG